jgi:murein DD-endopeptidase MepM/ murein hydrolase activator NlpD
MRILAFFGLAALAVVLAVCAEPLAPHAVLEPPVSAVGRATSVRVVGRDRGTGLRRIEVRLVPAGGGPGVVVAAEDFPRRLWIGSGVHEAVLTPTVDAAAAHLPEGPATLEVWVSDYSWLAALRRGPRLAAPITVDLTPPTVEVLTNQHTVRLGGAECVVYRVGSDATESGVAVGDRRFPGTAGLFADPTLRAALFAVPPDAPGARPLVVADDAVGNRRTVGIDVAVKPRAFPEKTLALADDFLARKVPELLQANGLSDDGDLRAGYLRINRELRATTEARVGALCRESAPTPLWEGAFLRLPNAAPLAAFADRRAYLYHGEVIDHQTHLGCDLASLRASPVPAANTGRVVFAGALGIYGNAVLLDHGLGLFSLYGHLSELAVAAGAHVARGDLLGKTGETGLAAGDHLHFSILIRGVYVDPVEWWDAHWIHDHVEARLAAFPRAPSGEKPS